MFITKLSGSNVTEDNFDNSIKILKDAMDCAKNIGDSRTASICICNMGILEGSKKFNTSKRLFMDDNYEMDFF